MRRSLRFKVAFVFSLLTIALLVAQALGVRVLAEAQEERLIKALIMDDMTNELRAYGVDPSLLPPLDPRVRGYVSPSDKLAATLPSNVQDLPNGVHEIILGNREIHVAIAPVNAARLYRIYDFSVYEKHFKAVIDALMVGTGIFALLTIWLAYGLSSLLVRQVAGLARQVEMLRQGDAVSINPGKYDEDELVGLIKAFNDYHRRMGEMIQREKEFAGNISHELRTPLTAIKTSCELLEQDLAISGKSRVRLIQIIRAADNMHELVNALLVLAREGSAQDSESVCLVHVIETALTPFTPSLADKGIDAAISIDRTLHIVANRSALAIVLSNVIDNAIHHTSHAHLCFSYEDGWLRIKDTGQGIPAHALAHVFDRFYQAAPEAANTRGCGLGLAIVKKLCDRYGWPIELDSEEGRGTRVSLRLAPGSLRPAGRGAGAASS